MDRSRFLALLILMFAVPSCQGREFRIGQRDSSDVYNHTLATILVEYASAVQLSDPNALITWTCSRCKDLTEGFQMIELIVDIQNCLQSFVGIDQGLNAIIIAFRGTQKLSIRNWIEDLLWKQLDLNYPDTSDAMVHHGFYAAYHNTTLRPGVVSAVQRAKELYGDIPVIATGHSMGGAIASFCALDLTINFGIHNVQLMTFGQPRVGNAAFASYFSKHVRHTVRVTNGHDIVPHLPPYYSYFPHKTYHHFPREVWIHNSRVSSTFVYMVEKICDESGEDPSCSRSVTGNSIMDHLTYMGVDMRADSSDSCGIVFYNDEKLHCHEVLAGNFVLSKRPIVSSVVQTTTDVDVSTDIEEHCRR